MSRAIAEGEIKVGKFGGTSMATPDRMRNVAGIITADSTRRIVTVSAPGNGPKDERAHDFRVTQALRAGKFDQVWGRFDGIARDMFGTDERYGRVAEAIKESSRRATEIGPYAESRGEFLSAKIIAEQIGATFIDPTQIIKLDARGGIHQDTYRLIPQYMTDGGLYVVAGYFGANVDTGDVQLLPPGGTDLTGSILAKGVGATLYENWTDVKGVLAADPRIVTDPKRIERLTYGEMGELAHRGVNVLLEDAVGPVMEANIPVNLKSSLEPEHPGTMVVGQRISARNEQIVGIASREGFVSVEVAKQGMATSPGFIASVGSIFAEEGISLEQGPGGRNHVSFIASAEQFSNGTAQTVMRRIGRKVEPQAIRLIDDIGLVAVVGQRLEDDATHVNARMYPALSNANIRTGAHIQSAEPNSIVFSVANRDVRRTVNVLYDVFIR